ncbi:transcription factor MYB3R-3 [Colletotrichum spaethianum]|uniref:Transcription factor MYB3R-3 n=1 Tax=Colletotrichum spaethianum TaxID=700344 RepID=A0AA37UIY0_9PEZI|nr:transcription factor MYB3R-3 [Colletotrichum spaethianum]GKT48779.1 transcription factor MYB3R-3 [Colletotrichum spaethianum]
MEEASSSSQSPQGSREWTVENNQQRILDKLSSILKDLERTLESIATVWDGQDMQNYPIGQVFGIFRKLLTDFELPPSQKARSGSGTAVLVGHLRTKTTLMVVQCYILCVNIMSTVAEKLWQAVSSLQLALQPAGPSSSMQNGQGHELQSGPFTQPSTSGRDVELETATRSIVSTGLGPSSSDSSNNGSSSVDEDFQIGESAPQLDPLAHALSSACATLRTGVRLLREIELVIGLPQEHGVAAKGLPIGGLPYDTKARCASGHAAGSPGPSMYIDLSCVARLVVVLWDEQGAATRFGSNPAGHGVGSEKTLTLLRRCYVDIVRLYKHHLSYYEIG